MRSTIRAVAPPLLATAALVVAATLSAVLPASPAAAQAPPSPELQRADTLFQEGAWEQAEAAYRALTGADDEGAGAAWFGLGRSLLELGRAEEAVAAFERALALGFDPPRTRFHGTRALVRAGRLDEAVAWLEAAEPPPPHSFVANESAFEVLRERDDFQRFLDRIRPCNSEEHHRFDFWVGEWEVRDQRRPGPGSRNVIRAVEAGCAVREEYATPSGYSGTSLSFYDAEARQWRQTWIDNQGQSLLLAGGWKGGSMVLVGPAGGPPANRITWTPLAEGRVRQLWESSPDGGATWQVVFDGLYVPAGGGE
ncbi:MAG TPA: tetratricopeptide repeat protein [Thermoanaerobaculia bacterium]|nr:tetratricopeptide repeat protein [Thermoanaerobaculia bacterium]